MMKKIVLLGFLIGISTVYPNSAFADFKITQAITRDGKSVEFAKMVKGSRMRLLHKRLFNTSKLYDLSISEVTQFDTGQRFSTNDDKKVYFLDSSIDSGNAGIEPQTTGGIVTNSYFAIDTGQRKQLFGVNLRRLKVSYSIERTRNSCPETSESRAVVDGWYADIPVEYELPLPKIEGLKSLCIDRVVVKNTGNTKIGFLFDGTITRFGNAGEILSPIRIETLDYSNSPLADSLFEIDKNYKRVDSYGELFDLPSFYKATMASNERISNNDETRKVKIGINRITDDVSKLDKNHLRRLAFETIISKNLDSSIDETSSAGFDYFIDIELKKIAESGAKTLGEFLENNPKNGTIQKFRSADAEVLITLYKTDGKTVILRESAAGTHPDSTDGAVKSAIGNGIDRIKSRYVSNKFMRVLHEFATNNKMNK